jgi:hypothetical protein
MRDTATTTASLIQASIGNPPPEGQFVRNPADGAVYRIVGGAPVYVSSFAAVPGSTNIRTISPEDLARLAQFPADGTLVEAGGWIYVIAGGAPIYLSHWDAIGGPRTPLAIDPLAVDNAGAPGVWSHLVPVPVDGTLLRAGIDIFVVAGGAPIYVSDPATVVLTRPSTQVDSVAVYMAGRPAPWNHLRFTPADNTVLAAGPSGSPIYLVQGGVPSPVSDPTVHGIVTPPVFVDPAAIQNAGIAPLWDHLNASPGQ